MIMSCCVLYYGIFMQELEALKKKEEEYEKSSKDARGLFVI